MAKKHVGIGIAAIAAGAGAATYMKKKSQKKQKKAQMDARYQDYRNTERGKQVKNKKGIYYSNGNYEAFARPEKPEGVEEKSAYIVGSGLASLAAACFLVRDGQMREIISISWKQWILQEAHVTVSSIRPEVTWT